MGSAAALLGSFGGHALGHVLTRTESSLLGKTALSRTIRGGLGEATEESLQGASGQYLQNLALRDHADTQQALSAGVANATVQGGIGAGPTGALLGGRARPNAATADHGPLGQALERVLSGEDGASEPLPEQGRGRRDSPLPRESGPPEPIAAADTLALPDGAFPRVVDPPATHTLEPPLSSSLSSPVSSPQAPPRVGGFFMGRGQIGRQWGVAR